MPKIRNEAPLTPTTRRRAVRRPPSEPPDPGRAEARDRLVAAGLRPTRPRVALLRLLFAKAGPHVTPDDLWVEVQAAQMPLSLATVYNNLNAFSEAGLLKRIVVGPGRVFFDTDTSHHHHVYFEEDDDLRSVPARKDGLVELPNDLAHVEPRRLDVIVRVRRLQNR